MLRIGEEYIVKAAALRNSKASFRFRRGSSEDGEANGG
jgi:hypothetical protein